MVANVKNLIAEVVSRLHAVVPDGVRIEVLDDTNAFAIFSTDGLWGTQGFGFFAGAGSLEELADDVEVALSGIQETLVHITNGAWPGLEDGHLPIPWATATADELHFGFGKTLILPPVAASTL